MDVQEAIRRSIRRHGLVEAGSKLVVAVSGGADSMALLHALVALRNQKTLDVHLIAASLDHGLRGAEGAADVEYVVEQCTRWQVTCITGHASTPALAKTRKLGTEEAARFARYSFLAQTAKEAGASKIATAHHADDQAETVLMRLLRGTGITGLASMGFQASMPYTPQFTIIRPLLNVTRKQIDAYNTDHGITPRHDASNDDKTYTRNYLRHNILPEIESRFPGAARALATLAESAAVENAFIDAALNEQTEPYIQRLPDQIMISRQQFRRLDPALQRRFLRKAIRELGMNEEIGHEHILAALEVLTTGEAGAVAEFPGGFSARLEREKIAIVLRLDN